VWDGVVSGTSVVSPVICPLDVVFGTSGIVCDVFVWVGDMVVWVGDMVVTSEECVMRP
jgi:hypothetical protein